MCTLLKPRLMHMHMGLTGERFLRVLRMQNSHASLQLLVACAAGQACKENSRVYELFFTLLKPRVMLTHMGPTGEGAV
jgi:hypothetical protein